MNLNRFQQKKIQIQKMPKAFETVLEIDLKALKQNFEYLKSRIKPETKFLAVVKAFGYGSDSVEVAKYLENLNVDYFAVAYTSEGIALRNAGIKTPILVLHPLPIHFEEIIEFSLEPNLYNSKVLKEFIDVLKTKKLNSYPIHIKFNTGLNRLGFSEKDIDTIIDKLKMSNVTKVMSIFSHLAATEDLNENDFTLTQIDAFKRITTEFKTKIGYTPITHILNTSGILNYANATEYDMVRSGIGLYGFGNDPKFDIHLKPIATLKTIISQIHFIEKGESVGYNRAFKALNNIKTATLPLGHADGIGRQYGNRKGFVTINGHKAPIIGNVCMDMIMVDITDIDCNEGDEVIVFGKNSTANELAASANTISYELITSISQRVKRVFLK